MTTRDLPSRIREFIRKRGTAVSSLLLAERFLRTFARTEALATALLRPFLGEAGLLYEPDLGWRLREPAGGVAAEAGLSGRLGVPFRNGARRPAGVPRAAASPERRVACAVALAGARSGAARICLMEIPAAGSAEGRDDAARPPRVLERRHWRAVSRFLRDADAVLTDPRREAPEILGGLVRRGLPGPARVRSLASAVRGAVRLPRGSTPEQIAEILGCAYLEEDSPRAAAANIAALVRRADGLRQSRGARKDAPEPDGCPELHVRRVLSRSFLETVPPRPGVYSFFDEKGGLLYVGKAANLRRRLSSYAAPAAAMRSPRGRPGELERLHRVECRVLGSDLEALLEEARLIAMRSPRVNIQRRVHERGRRYAPARTWALLLPSGEPAAVIALFVRDGLFEGWCRLGPRGGGGRKAAQILKHLLRLPGAGGRSMTSEKGRGGPSGAGRRSGRRRERSGDPRSEILNSWLARHGDRFSQVDLDSCAGPGSALRLLMEGAREEARGCGEVAHHRHPASRRRGRRGAAAPPMRRRRV